MQLLIQFILSITLQQNKGNCLTVNMNENKTGVITQIIPRYTSEYYRNLDYITYRKYVQTEGRA